MFTFKKIVAISRLKYSNGKSSKIILFALSAVAVLVITVVLSGITVGYSIKYGDSYIATVKSKSDFDSAVKIADTSVEKFEFSDYVYKPKFSLKLTLNRSFATPESVAELLLENTDEIFYGSELFVNGTLKACIAGQNALKEYIEEALHRYDVEGAECSAEFMDVVTVTDGYFPKSELTNSIEAKKMIDEISIVTKANVYTTEAVAFDTVTYKSDERTLGDIKTLVKGVNGEIRHYQNVVYVNGVEIARENLSTEVYKEPIDEIVVIGTAPAYVSAGNMESVTSAGLIWPLQKVEGWNISSYFGDGRGHKGIDICTKAGTSIYAAQSGVVEKATFGSGYGNYVIIDHGNGFKTLYAHCSKLYVSAGDEVTQYQVIAAVGSTGNSSGNHLHFEVHVNGKQIDPAPYLGLY